MGAREVLGILGAGNGQSIPGLSLDELAPVFFHLHVTLIKI